jgi:hypothetical protein
VSSARAMNVADTEAALRAMEYRHGSTYDQAAIELLIRHDVWLRRPEFRDLIEVEDGEAVLDWSVIATELEGVRQEPDAELPDWLIGATDSEAHVLQIACSIAVTRHQINLHVMLAGLDSSNAALVARAVLHALDCQHALVATYDGKRPLDVPIKARDRIVWDPATAPPAPSVWDTPDVVALAAISAWNLTQEGIRNAVLRVQARPAPERVTPHIILDESGNPRSRDAYAAELAILGGPNDHRRALLSTGEAQVVARLLSVLGGLLPREPLGGLAYHYSTMIKQRGGLHPRTGDRQIATEQEGQS